MHTHTSVGAARRSALNRTAGAWRSSSPPVSKAVQGQRLAALGREFAKGTVEFARNSVRRFRWLKSRAAVIEEYFAMHAVRKLHLGCGPVLLDGWLNADLRPRTARHLFLDVTERFPFPDRSLDYILAEHLIGDLTYPQAAIMLTECHRVLKPGGRLRIATPSLARLAELYTPARSQAHEHYVTWAIEEFVGWADAPLEGLVINNLFQEHPFVYDPSTLTHVLHRAGFVNITEQPFGRSDDPHLDGVDSHGRVVGDAEISRFESVTMEAERG